MADKARRGASRCMGGGRGGDGSATLPTTSISTSISTTLTISMRGIVVAQESQHTHRLSLLQSVSRRGFSHPLTLGRQWQ
jgi:hypothetical protein